MLVGARAACAFCALRQRQNRRFLRQEPFLTQLVRRRATQSLRFHAYRMPFFRYACRSCAATARPRPGLADNALQARVARHGMRVLSSKHGATVFFQELPRLCETKQLVTIFLPNPAASLLAGCQQRELALAFSHGKVIHVTLAPCPRQARRRRHAARLNAPVPLFRPSAARSMRRSYATFPRPRSIRTLQPRALADPELPNFRSQLS